MENSTKLWNVVKYSRKQQTPAEKLECTWLKHYEKNQQRQGNKSELTTYIKTLTKFRREYLLLVSKTFNLLYSKDVDIFGHLKGNKEEEYIMSDFLPKDINLKLHSHYIT